MLTDLIGWFGRRGIYYGWVIIAVTFVTLFVSTGFRFAFGVYYSAILDETGCDDVVDAVPDRREVGEDDVDAGLVLLGEEDAAVDHQQLAGVLEHRHVAADLAEPAQRDHAQAALGQGRRRPEFGMTATHALNVTAGPRRP